MKQARTIYHKVGGMKMFRRLAKTFYGRVERDPLLRPLFALRMDRPRERLALFLAETFGGPKEYTKRRGARTLQDMHARFRIDHHQIQAWKRNMYATLREIGIEKPLLSVMRGYFCENAE